MLTITVCRRVDEGGRRAIEELLRAASRAKAHRALSEQKWLELASGGELFAAVSARGSDGRLAAYAQVGRRPDGWAVEYVLGPDHEEEPQIRSELLAAATKAVSSAGGGAVRLWIAKPAAEDDEAALAGGFALWREIYQMRRPLPFEGERSAIATRPFRPGADEKEWLAVNNRAFSGHPEQGTWTLGDLAEREREPWFDPSGFLIAEMDGSIAGFCWTKIQDDYAGDGQIGEIYVIAVDPHFQHKGLGRHLVVAGLEHMEGQGLSKAMLYVDGENRGARQLYRYLGFSDDHVDRAYSSVVV